MKKIDLTEYEVVIDGKKMPYMTKDAIVEILFNPERKLTAVDLLRTNDLAQKIVGCEGDSVLLENAEYENVRAACMTVKGFSKPDVELVRRLMEPETVEVIEKDKKPEKGE